MQSLEKRIPPPLVLLITVAAMGVLVGLTAGVQLAGGAQLAAAIAIMLAGLLIAGSGVAAFRRAQTTINPRHPEQAALVVRTGIYARTRNPMYLGMVCLLIGWALLLSAPWALLGPLAFLLYIDRFQIQPEERALAAKFGAQYTEYLADVRRWL